MSDQSSNPPVPNGADPAPARRSLREVAESVYDDLLDADSGSSETSAEQSIDGDGRPRDASGRFVAKDQATEPGVADDPVPAPTDESPRDGEQPQPAPAQPGSSIEAPAHWAADDRAAFKELPPKGQELFLKRYSAIERDYTQKTQAAAQAVNFAQTLAPVFQNPHMAESLRSAGVGPSEAINQWGQFHMGIINPDPQVRLATVQEIARRAQIDPAALAPGRPGPGAPLSPEALKDPALKFFAEQVGKLQQEIVSNRQQLQGVQNQWAARQADEAQRMTQWQVDTFADEKDARGQPLRPYFDRVVGEIMLLYRGDPQNFDMGKAYQRACYMNESVREEMQQAGRQIADQQASNQRAALAARSNLKGRTTPVSAPNGAGGDKRSLRETLEAAADEAGFN